MPPLLQRAFALAAARQLSARAPLQAKVSPVSLCSRPEALEAKFERLFHCYQSGDREAAAALLIEAARRSDIELAALIESELFASSPEYDGFVACGSNADGMRLFQHTLSGLLFVELRERLLQRGWQALWIPSYLVALTPLPVAVYVRFMHRRSGDAEAGAAQAELKGPISAPPTVEPLRSPFPLRKAPSLPGMVPKLPTQERELVTSFDRPLRIPPGTAVEELRCLASRLELHLLSSLHWTALKQQCRRTLDENSQPRMAKSRVNPKGCEQDASNNWLCEPIWPQASLRETLCLSTHEWRGPGNSQSESTVLRLGFCPERIIQLPRHSTQAFALALRQAMSPRQRSSVEPGVRSERDRLRIRSRCREDAVLLALVREQRERVLPSTPLNELQAKRSSAALWPLHRHTADHQALRVLLTSRQSGRATWEQSEEDWYLNTHRLSKAGIISCFPRHPDGALVTRTWAWLGQDEYGTQLMAGVVDERTIHLAYTPFFHEVEGFAPTSRWLHPYPMRWTDAPLVAQGMRWGIPWPVGSKTARLWHRAGFRGELEDPRLLGARGARLQACLEAHREDLDWVSKAVLSLHWLDQGRIEEAFGLLGIQLDPTILALLDATDIPAALFDCAPQLARSLRQTLSSAAPWRLSSIDANHLRAQSLNWLDDRLTEQSLLWANLGPDKECCLGGLPAFPQFELWLDQRHSEPFLSLCETTSSVTTLRQTGSPQRAVAPLDVWQRALDLDIARLQGPNSLARYLALPSRQH
ncbi:MAG: hypothetical protein RBU37_02730 [Myxococcota bacterium]|nr:hypothetical protein [Myxococcota bacterium]